MIYITGNKGFIAYHLTKELINNGYAVTGADIKDIYNTDYRKNGVALGEFKKHKPTLVIHNAAQVGRLFGEDDYGYTIESNALMTTHVAQACGELNIPMMYLSTSEVYGDQGENVCFEGGPMIIPHNLYGLSKKWGEEAAALYCSNLQIIRLSMPYGIGLPAGIGRAAIINFIYNAINGLPITVHKDSERSWCWVKDTVAGIRMVIQSGEKLTLKEDYHKGIGIYNIGRTDNFMSMMEVAEIACDISGASKDLIQMIDAPKNQTKIKKLSNKKIIELGWMPEVNVYDGMKVIYENLKN